MRILLAVILTLSLGLLSSCTAPAGLVADSAKLHIDNPDVSTVTVMRKSQVIGSPIRIKFFLDHELIAHLGPGDRVEFQVLPGDHYVAVSFRNIWGQEPEAFAHFNANAKRKYYFYSSMELSSGEILHLVELTPEEGEKELAENKYELLTAGK